MKQTLETQCLGKTPHATREDAERAVRIMRQRGKRNMTIYPCGFGNRYHISHANGGIRRNRRAYRRKFRYN